MRILQSKHEPQKNTILQEDPAKDGYWWAFYDGKSVPFVLYLERENNRGWTLSNNTFSQQRVNFFFSRGEFEMLEE